MMPMPSRILIVLPLYGGSLPIGRYCAEAMRHLGHTVEVFDGPAFYGAFSALKELQAQMNKQEELENALLQVLGQAVHAKAECFQPDLVLALAQAPLPSQILKRFRRDGIPTAMWFVEDYRLFPYWRSVAPLYDFFFVIQKGRFLEQLQQIGANPFYLPLAASPAFHQKYDITDAERNRFGATVSFLGAGYPNRRVAFRELIRHRFTQSSGFTQSSEFAQSSGEKRPLFKIWGSDWENEPELTPYLQDSGARVSSEDAVRIFNATDINLNLHSSISPEPPVQTGDFVNPRTFELAACGAFQLVDRRELLSELFQLDGDDKELATFSTFAAFCDCLDWYLDRPEERQQLAERARNRVLSEHTYQQRMAQVMCFVGEADDPLPCSESFLDTIAALGSNRPDNTQYSGIPSDFESLQRAGEALLADLHLPVLASFKDVLVRLRSKGGVRTPFESALLFFDALRKQRTGT